MCDGDRGIVTIIACVRRNLEIHGHIETIANPWDGVLFFWPQGLGTDDRRLTRIVVGRCEHDMVEIKAVFQKIYRKSLESWVRSETSGSYRHLLLMLIGTGST